MGLTDVFLCSFKKPGTSFSSTVVTINFIISSILVHFDFMLCLKKQKQKQQTDFF